MQKVLPCIDMNGRIESLHNHTKTSDGLMDHKELFALASKKKFGVLAYTDHDALPDKHALSYLESIRTEETKWVIGIEMTVGYPEMCGGRRVGSLHLLGLFVDPQNELLVEHCEMAQRARIVRMRTMVDSLNSLGLNISEEDCLRFSDGESIGRPHIVSAIDAHPENKQVISRLIRSMQKDAENDERIKEKYEQMIARGESSYPYVLFLSPDAYRPAYAEISYLPTFEHAVEMIHSAGGVAGIAHYYTTKRRISLAQVELLLSQGEIDGMEVVYGSHTSGNSDDALHAERKEIKRIVQTLGKLPFGGGDIHTKDDVDAYVAAQVSGESVGITRIIAESGKVDVRWSSLG